MSGEKVIDQVHKVARLGGKRVGKMEGGGACVQEVNREEGKVHRADVRRSKESKER